jgi:hypothetical protein
VYIIVSRLSTLFLLWDHEFVMIFHVELQSAEASTAVASVVGTSYFGDATFSWNLSYDDIRFCFPPCPPGP